MGQKHTWGREWARVTGAKREKKGLHRRIEEGKRLESKMEQTQCIEYCQMKTAKDGEVGTRKDKRVHGPEKGKG